MSHLRGPTVLTPQRTQASTKLFLHGPTTSFLSFPFGRPTRQIWPTFAWSLSCQRAPCRSKLPTKPSLYPLFLLQHTYFPDQDLYARAGYLTNKTPMSLARELPAFTLPKHTLAPSHITTVTASKPSVYAIIDYCLLLPCFARLPPTYTALKADLSALPRELQFPKQRNGAPVASVRFQAAFCHTTVRCLS